MDRSSTPAELEALREQIDRLDAELIDLLIDRLDLARKIGAAKASCGLAIVDPRREQQVIARAIARCGNKLPLATVAAVIETLIQSARAVQAQLRIAHLGPAGTHSEAAARAFFPDAELVPEPSLPEVIAALGSRAELAVVPWWNRHYGPVREVHAAMIDARVRPLRWVNLPVSHVLARRAGPEKGSTTLLARPEPLVAARSWIERELPGLRIEHVASNGAAAEQAAARPGTLALTTEAAAALHGLEVIARDIDTPGNVTTFAVLGTE